LKSAFTIFSFLACPSLQKISKKISKKKKNFKKKKKKKKKKKQKKKKKKKKRGEKFAESLQLFIYEYKYIFIHKLLQAQCRD